MQKENSLSLYNEGKKRKFNQQYLKSINEKGKKERERECVYFEKRKKCKTQGVVMRE